MSISIVIILTVVFSALIYYLIALRCQKLNKTPFAFFYADGKISGTDFSATFSGANITMTSIFIYFAAQAPASGLSTFTAPLFWILGIILFFWLSPRLKQSFEKGQTIHQYLASAYSSRSLQSVTSIVTIFAFIGTVGLEFVGFSWFLQYFEVSRQSTLMIGIGLIVAMGLYTVVGGYWATIKTDLIQVILTLGGCLAFLALFVKSPWVSEAIRTDHLTSLKTAIETGSLLQDPAFILGMAVLLIPFQFSVMDMWQRCVATGGSIRHFRRQTLGAGVALGFIFCVPVIIGLSQTGNSIDQPLFQAVVNLGEPFLIAVIAAMLLASVFSTADTLLLAAANSAIVDLFAKRHSEELTAKVLDASDVTVMLARISVVVLSVGCLFVFGVAAAGFGLGEIIIGVFGAQAILGFLVLYSILSPEGARQRPRGAVAAAFIGLVLPVPLVVVGKVLQLPDLTNAAPLISISIALLALRLIPREKS